MKKVLLFATLLAPAAGYFYLQQTAAPPPPKLAALMPGGALLYLEAQDFGRLLREWDASNVKSDWLASENYEVFSRSNLFTKLSEVYDQYSVAAGFVPGLGGVREIAGTESALALYGIRDVEFLYVSRVGDAELVKSQLWTLRNKFEQRQAGGVVFYLRTDPSSKRTVAFASAKGLLLVATRDDLVAQALELLAGAGNSNVASDRWYRDSSAAAANPGELRLVMNLEALVRSDYFRSYWVQRNAPAVRQYWAGVADVTRSAGAITESRVFLRQPAAQPARDAAGDRTTSDLLALVPPEAGLYKASAADSAAAATLIVQKLISPQIDRTRDWRFAPMAVSSDQHAGSEGDLETRIDEPPLPEDAGMGDSEATVRGMLEKGGARSVLLLQASSPSAGTFVSLGSVMVVAGSSDWDRDAVRDALTAAAGKLWTVSKLGAGWTSSTSGRHTVERMDGLGTLAFAERGHLLFLGNDANLLAAALDRAGSTAGGETFSYAAGVRHVRERPNFERVMRALDFGSAGRAAPAFFSGNLASLSRVLSAIEEVRLTEEEREAQTLQTVVYRLGQ